MSTKQEYVHVPITYEYMMSHLFGKHNYHGHVGGLSKTAWKKDLRKINKYIKKSVDINLNSDAYHKGMLAYLCDCLDQKISDAKSLNEVNVSFVETYTRLIFTLLGNFPNHWNRKAPYAERFWELDGHRTSAFVQTDEQKAALVLNLVDIKKAISVELKDFENMHEAFSKCKSDASLFIKWLKKNHPEIYCEIF